MSTPIDISSPSHSTLVYSDAPRSAVLIAFLRAAAAFVRVVINPTHLQHVINFVDALTSLPVVTRPIVEAMRELPQGRRALKERPRVGRIAIDALLQRPGGSLGHLFAEHLQANGLDPAALPARKALSDDQYVTAHLYETHDIWHVATGFKTDIAGELGLEAFYAAQIPSRVAVGILSIGLVQTLFKGFADRQARFEQISRGWRMGRRALPLIGLDWAALWNVPLAELQRQLQIESVEEPTAAVAQAQLAG